MTDAFAALADENRRRILAGLADDGDELNVGALVERLDLSQPTISKHLKVLREAGLVTVREAGQRRFYRVDMTGLRPILTWLQQFPGLVPPSEPAPVKESAANADRLGFPPPNPSGLARTLGHSAAWGVGGARGLARGIRIQFRALGRKLPGRFRRS